MVRILKYAFVALAAGAMVGQANLLLNPSFENALSSSDWGTTWGSGQFARETWNNPPDGSWAIYLKGTWAGGDNFGGGFQQVTSGITPGWEYRLSAYFYWDNNWSAQYQAMKLEFFDSNWQQLAAHTNYLQNLPEATWTLREITATAPANTAYAQVVFEGSGFGSEGVLGADNFVLVTTIPEPTTAALSLLGLGLVAYLRRRK